MVIPLIENFISKIMPPKNMKTAEDFISKLMPNKNKKVLAENFEDDEDCDTKKHRKIFAYIIIIICIIIALILSFTENNLNLKTSNKLFNLGDSTTSVFIR